MKTLEKVSSGDYGVYFGTDWTREKLVLDMKWFGKQKIKAQTIIEDRKSFFLEGYNSFEFPGKPTARVASRFTMQHEKHFEQPNLKERLQAEIREYVEFGVTQINTGRRRRRDLERNFHGNQTFYPPQSRKIWRSQDNCNPFLCYSVDYELERYDGVSTTMVTLFLEKLRLWVKTFQRIKKEGWDLKIYLWLGDCVELCDGLPESLKFDFIHTSNLSDRIGIVPLLVHCQDRLKRDDGILTIESYQWPQMLCSVEAALKFCVDIHLLMYPTLIGLHLVDDLKIGHERLLESGGFVGCGSLILTWKIARKPSPLYLTGSDDVSKSLREMFRPNTEQKKSLGPQNIQLAGVTKFDIDGRNKLIKRLQPLVARQGLQMNKIVEDFLIGSVPESLKFMFNEDNLSNPETTDVDSQWKVIEFINRYEVTLTYEPKQMTGQFSYNYKDGCCDVVVFSFTENGEIRFSNTVFLSSCVSLSNIKVSKEEGTVRCVLWKDMELINSEKLMPREITSQEAISNSPEFPDTKFGHQLLSTYLFRMYPLQNKPPVAGRDEIQFGEQLHDLTAFLMETYMKSNKSVKVFGIPSHGLQQYVYKWTAIFLVDELKLWEDKPRLFLTFYDVQSAFWMSIPLQEVQDVVHRLKPEATFREFEKYINGYFDFARNLRGNGARVEQDTPDVKRWIWKTFVSPRYKHFTYELFHSEVEYHHKVGEFPTDPKDFRDHIKKLASVNPLTAGLTLKEDILDDACKMASRMTNPGYSGYGAAASRSSNVTPSMATASAMGSNPLSSLGRSPETEKCDGCGKVSRELKKCEGCKTVVYCNKECQHQAWKTHKVLCKK